MGVPDRSRKGFTLIEMMVTVAIVAILAGVALPSYRQYIIRGNRSAAQAQMLDIANREEQFLLANRAYADTAALTASGYALPPEVGANYTFAVTAAADSATGAPTYTITFTPQNGQSGDGALGLKNDGTKTPADKWK